MLLIFVKYKFMPSGFYKRTNYHKESIRKSLLGRKITWDTGIKKYAFKKGNTPWNKGTKGICKPNNGSFKKGQNKGIKSSRWKGGVSSLNVKIRGTSEYKVWRLDVYKRDWFTCQMPGCGYKGKDIECHHIKRVKDYPDLIIQKNNGITLCKKCHKSIRGKENKYEKLFENIVYFKRIN